MNLDDGTRRSAEVTSRPAPAERARSVLVSAASVRVTTDRGEVDLLGSHADRGDGTVLLAPGSGRLAAEAAAGAGNPGGEIAARLELADLAPVSTRSRVRALLGLSGWITVAGDGVDGPLLSFEPVELVLSDVDGVLEVDVDDYAAAAPDPLAAHEAELLSHLEAAHSQEIAALTRLLPAAPLHSAVRVLPLTLDRYGLVLRAERLRDYSDIRLPFERPVDDLVSAQAAFCALVERARQCARGRPSFGPSTR